MIKISKKADYAVLVMANLAHRTLAHRTLTHSTLAHRTPIQSGEAAGATALMPPASAQDVADQVGLSRALVANILKALTRKGLLQSVRGAGGGYRFARPIEEISLAEIIAALEGPLRVVDCASIEGHAPPEQSGIDCSLSDHCPSRSAMRVVHDRIAALMDDIFLPELLRLENRAVSNPS